MGGSTVSGVGVTFSNLGGGTLLRLTDRGVAVAVGVGVLVAVAVGVGVGVAVGVAVAGLLYLKIAEFDRAETSFPRRACTR